MRSRLAAIVTPLLVVACSHTSTPSAADSTAAGTHLDDSIIALRTQQAPALADTARSTLAVLLQHPESAIFDSLIVMQPPKAEGSWPAPVVCGRIGGKPGIGGRSTLTSFVYQSRINVFVLDPEQRVGIRRAPCEGCDNPAAHVLLR